MTERYHEPMAESLAKPNSGYPNPLVTALENMYENTNRPPTNASREEASNGSSDSSSSSDSDNDNDDNQGASNHLHEEEEPRRIEDEDTHTSNSA
nr:hypothetical protein Itr_chr10CG11510 [Ipomoea trifida]